MAQLNLTLDQNDIRRLMNNDQDGIFALILQESIDRLLKSDENSEAAIQAAANTTDTIESASTVDIAEPVKPAKAAAGTAPGATMRIGTVPLKVPADLNEPFRTLVLHNYSMSEAGLISVAAEMAAAGMANRSSTKFIRSICGSTVPKLELTALCAGLTEKINAFRTRPLTEEYPFVTFGVNEFGVLRGGKTIKMPLMLALAVSSKGRRDIIGYGIYPEQNVDAWTDFLRSLKERGLTRIRMYISAQHPGLREAMATVYPETPWQRCQIHFTNDVLSLAPESYSEKLREEIKSIFRCKTMDEAVRRKDDVISKYSKSVPKAMEELERGFPDAMTSELLPESIRKSFHTTSRIEGLNKELLRRGAAVGTVPGPDSLDRLIGSYLLERSSQIAAMNRIFFRTAFVELESCVDVLRDRAAEQLRR